MALQEELRRVLRSVELVGMTEEILTRAAAAMPTVMGTLEGRHLATAVELQRELNQPVTVATHDV